MELRVLEGAKRTIATHRPILWIEYWLDKDNICKTLHQLGYGLRPVRGYYLNFAAICAAMAARVLSSRLVAGAQAVLPSEVTPGEDG